MVFASLPHSYNPVLTTISTSMHLLKQCITATKLMSTATDAYDQFVTQGTVKYEQEEGDIALNADVKKDKGKGHVKKFDGNCNNCGWHGHQSRDCWEEGSGRHGQALKHWKSRLLGGGQ